MDTDTSTKRDILHGLTFEPARNRWRIRLTVSRGRKVIGKRIVVDTSEVTEAEAIGARDAVLAALAAVGLGVAKRPCRKVGQCAEVTCSESFGTMAA